MIGQNMNKRRIKVFLYQTDFPHNILFSIRGQRAFHTCQCGLCGPMSVSCQDLIFKKKADFRTNISRQSPTEFVFWITQVTSLPLLLVRLSALFVHNIYLLLLGFLGGFPVKYKKKIYDTKI